MLPKLTSLSLSLWIAGVLAAQLLLAAVYGFVRQWVDYVRLKEQVAGGVPMAAVAAPAASAPEPGWKGLRPFIITHKTYEDAAKTVASFHFTPEDKAPLPSYRPGQFLTFSLPLPDGETISRCYSLSDAAQAGHYRCSIKRVDKGRSSSHFHDRLEVGSRIMLRAPSGGFFLAQGLDPVVLIGGGIGITPMLAMANTALAETPGREIWLFYGVKTAEEAIMLPHFRALAAQYPNFHFVLCISDGAIDANDTHMRRGRITLDLLRLMLPFKPFSFYICGPTPMMESLVHGLEDWGVPGERIHFEAFGPSTITRKNQPVIGRTDEPAFAITFRRSGKTVAWEGKKANLLDLADAHGVSIDSSCRSGTCGTCQTKLVEGDVTYAETPVFEVEDGHCLPCICRPASAVTVEA